MATMPAHDIIGFTLHGTGVRFDTQAADGSDLAIRMVPKPGTTRITRSGQRQRVVYDLEVEVISRLARHEQG